MTAMCGSSVHPFPTMEKACSGKCRGTCASGAPKLWVIAACNGMVSLFEKSGTELHPVTCDGETIFSSMERFHQLIKDSAEQDKFNQLVVVGASNDVAWIHTSLPQTASRRIVAEMQYPLLPGWFPDTSQLSHVLQTVLL